MSIFEQLAEAKIQDWIRRGRPRPKAIDGDLTGSTLESQLLGEIIALRLGASSETDHDARDHLLVEAQKREVQLLVLLESTGRPLAAKALAERLQQI